MKATALPSESGLRSRVLERTENRPGVYRFIGPRNEVLYVGKSVRLRTRLLGYFRQRPGSKAHELLRVSTGVEWEYSPNEFEALLREFRLIRSFRPRFNVRHRRERRFAWIRLTSGAAPRLVACRSPRSDGSRHFGPFPAPRNLPAILRDLAHEIGLRDCPDNTPMHFAEQLDLLDPTRTPGCIRAELGSCPAPCAGRCTSAEYHQGVEAAVAFLEGRSDAPLRALARRMEKAAAARDFERAARFRDRRERLDDLRRSVAEFGAYLKTLRFVYRLPGHSPEEDRRYVILGGRVRMTLSGGSPESSRMRDTGKNALQSTADGDPSDCSTVGTLSESERRTLFSLLREPAPSPASLSPAAREELFLVSRWFRRRPRELERTRALPDRHSTFADW